MQRPDHDATVARELSELLHRIGVVRFGEFTLKDGRRSPFYLDMRVLVSHVLRAEGIDVAGGYSVDDWQSYYESATRLAEYLNFAGYNAAAKTWRTTVPMIYVRKEAKGTAPRSSSRASSRRASGR
jgi:orotate phosphoribosyltransferase